MFGVKKVAHELSGPFLKVGHPQAENDSNNPSDIFPKMVFLLEVLIEIYYKVSTNYSINLFWLYEYNKTAKHIKNHVCVIFTHSAVL